MRARTLTVLVVVGLLSVFAADITTGCGQDYVYGSVTQKINAGHEQDSTIVVNGSPFEVPLSFFERVQVGDMVRFNGKEWSIVKPGQSSVPAPYQSSPATAPSTPPPAQPAPAAPSTP